MGYIRAKIELDKTNDVVNFVQQISKLEDNFIVEDFSGAFSVNAKSYLGMLYASADFMDMFIVNKTNDGVFPGFIDEYRI